MKRASRQHLLLLTATVVPKSGQSDLAIVDPQVRLQEYGQALQFYQHLLQSGVIDGVIFVENSGYDLALLAAQFSHPAIEWMALAPMDYDPSWHRGYGEFCMIDHVMAHSQQVRQATPDALIWKVTGRYRVSNLARLVAWAPAAATLYGQLSAYWWELSVIAWTRGAYQRVLHPQVSALASAMAPELILAAGFPAACVAEPGVVPRFVWPPWLEGRRATNGARYRGRLGAVRHLLAVITGLLSALPAIRVPHRVQRGW